MIHVYVPNIVCAARVGLCLCVSVCVGTRVKGSMSSARRSTSIREKISGELKWLRKPKSHSTMENRYSHRSIHFT